MIGVEAPGRRPRRTAAPDADCWAAVRSGAEDACFGCTIADEWSLLLWVVAAQGKHWRSWPLTAWKRLMTCSRAGQAWHHNAAPSILVM